MAGETPPVPRDRCLRPRSLPGDDPPGSVLLSFHQGEDELFADEWEGQEIFWVASLFELDEVTETMTRSGFSIEHAEVRNPYEFEYPTKRAYILAQKQP